MRRRPIFNDGSANAVAASDIPLCMWRQFCDEGHRASTNAGSTGIQCRIECRGTFKARE